MVVLPYGFFPFVQSLQSDHWVSVEVTEPGMRMRVPGLAVPVTDFLRHYPGVIPEELPKVLNDLVAFAALRFHVGNVSLVATTHCVMNERTWQSLVANRISMLVESCPVGRRA